VAGPEFTSVFEVDKAISQIKDYLHIAVPTTEEACGDHADFLNICYPSKQTFHSSNYYCETAVDRKDTFELRIM